MKTIYTISERRFDKIAVDLQDGARASLWEMWRDDLNTNMSKQELIMNANSLLAYFGSEVLISDVDWDERGNCFEWEVVVDQPR
jgi:hypothetical protein